MTEYQSGENLNRGEMQGKNVSVIYQTKSCQVQAKYVTGINTKIMMMMTAYQIIIGR